jgi:hypothetical protein
MAIRSRNVPAAKGVVSGGNMARPYSSPTCCTALDDDRLAGADRQNLAAKLRPHQNFENFAGLDSIDRQTENDEIGKVGLKDRPEVLVLCAFAGYEAEIFKNVGEERSQVPLGVYNAYTRYDFATPKGC